MPLLLFSNNKGCVSDYGLAIYAKKTSLRQKKNYENSYISPCKNNIIFKKSSERNQNLSRYHNSITNIKFQLKAKISSFRNPDIKIDLLLLPRGPKSLKLLLYSIKNLNTTNCHGFASLPLHGGESVLDFGCWPILTKSSSLGIS